jgi:hypothetical protein
VQASISISSAPKEVSPEQQHLLPVLWPLPLRRGHQLSIVFGPIGDLPAANRQRRFCLSNESESLLPHLLTRRHELGHPVEAVRHHKRTHSRVSNSSATTPALLLPPPPHYHNSTYLTYLTYLQAAIMSGWDNTPAGESSFIALIK